MSIEYKQNPDGTYALWSCGQAKMTKDVLTVQKAQIGTNIAALTGIEGLSKEEAQVVAQIVQQQSDLMKKPDFSWAEIVGKFKKPLEEQIAALDSALSNTVSPK